MIKRLLYAIHRILGTVLSILFLVWFLSGFVMIYHKFPKVSSRDKYKVMEALLETDIQTDSLLSFIPSEEKVLKLSLKSFSSKPYWEIATDKGNYTILVDEEYKFIEGNKDYPILLSYAQRWNNASINKVDTLYKLEQWIPFGYLRKDFPIYKFYFGDKEKHQLYVSSLSGEALQYTSNESRFWSWLGAIPHWIYFTSLRQNSALWKEVIIWLSGLGCIMCIAGIILGIRAYRANYKR
ncbi:MAG: hypothetical protein LIO65_00415 [Odoribacter sp.]|nr:hypothetical protein [Odoribacter sp.]